MPCMPLPPCSLMALFCSVAGPALLVKASDPFLLINTSTSLPTRNVACPCITACFLWLLLLCSFNMSQKSITRCLYAV